MTRPTRLVGLGATLVVIACAKVPNPFYVDELGDEASGTASESESAESSESSESGSSESSESESSDTSESTDASDSTDSSSEDTDCPPSESGCPCLQGTQCFPGLTCVDGICFVPEDCALENPDVRVQWTYDINGMQPPADTNCMVQPMMQNTALTLAIAGCNDGVTTLSVELDPLPPELAPIVDLGNVSVGVRLHFEQDSAFVRLTLNGYDLWLVDGALLVSGNASVSDYPGEVAAVVGECPSEPKFCGEEVGELQRRGVRVLGQPIFDGNSGLVDVGMYAWVDVAQVDCMVPNYRFAILDGP